MALSETNQFLEVVINNVKTIINTRNVLYVEVIAGGNPLVNRGNPQTKIYLIGLANPLIVPQDLSADFEQPVSAINSANAGVLGSADAGATGALTRPNAGA